MTEREITNLDIAKMLRLVIGYLEERKRQDDFRLPQELLSVSDVAELLDVSEVTVRSYIKSGRLTASKPGHSYIIPASSVSKLLESFRVK